MKASYGFIETRGYIAAVVAADAMVKAAKVELVRYRKIGSAYVTVIVKGELGACQAAVAAGAETAKRIGEFISSHIIANPFDDTEAMLEQKKPGVKPIPSASIIKKPKTPKSPRQKRQTPEQKILSFLAFKKEGASLKEIARFVRKSVAEARILIKKLMDEGKIEKIQQKYYYNQ